MQYINVYDIAFILKNIKVYICVTKKCAQRYMDIMQLCVYAQTTNTHFNIYLFVDILQVVLTEKIVKQVYNYKKLSYIKKPRYI